MKKLNELIQQCEKMCEMLTEASYSNFITVDQGRALEGHKWQVSKLKSQLQEMRG